MPKIVETIPSSLAAEAEAARAWFAAARGSEFKVTGIVDPDEVGEPDRESGHEIQLILCGSVDGQDVCLRERFRVAASNGGYSVTHLEEKTPALGSPAPLLDPPAGVRSRWLDAVMNAHGFVVILFYRGFW